MIALVLLALAAGPPVPTVGPLPNGAIARLGTDSLRGHLTFYGLLSPDGKEIVVQGLNGLTVHDAATGRPLRGIAPAKDAGPPGGLGSYSGDGRIVAFEDENHVVVMNTRAGTTIARLKVDRLRAWGRPSLSHNGDFAAILARGGELAISVVVFDVKRGRQLATLPMPRDTIGLAISPDGKKALTWGNGLARAWDVATGRARGTYGEARANAAACSPDGRKVAVYADREVVLYDAASMLAIRTFKGAPERGQFCGVAFSPKGKRLAAWGEKGIVAWDAGTGKRVAGGANPVGPVLGAGFTAGGVIAMGLDGMALRLWNATTGRAWLPTMGHTMPVTSLAFTADGALASAGADGLRLWAWTTGRQTRHLAHLAKGKPPSPFKRGWLLDANGTTALYWGEGGPPVVWGIKEGRSLKRPEVRGSPERLAALSRDGAVAAVGPSSSGGGVAVWETRTGKLLATALLPASGSFEARVALSPAGRLLAASTGGKGAHLCNLKTERWRPLFPPPENTCGVAFSPDGKTLAVCGNARVTLYDVRTARPVRELRVGRGRLGVVEFSPDGRYLAAAELYRPEAFLLELLTGQTRLALEGHAESVTAFGFSPDSGLLATGGQRGSVLVWDVSGQHQCRADDAKARDAEALTATRASDALAAMCRLARSPKRAVALLRARLRPLKVATPSEEKLKQLTALLDDEDAALRRAAELALQAADRRALPHLGASPRARRLRARIEKGPLLQSRGVEVLERLGTPDARKLLRELAAGDAEARLTVEAKAALKRLEKSP
jgi:WD40 repeat protein